MKYRFYFLILVFLAPIIAFSQIFLCFDSTKKLTAFGGCNLKIKYPIVNYNFPLNQDSNFYFDKKNKYYYIQKQKSNANENDFHSITLDVSNDTILVITRRTENKIYYVKNFLSLDLKDRNSNIEISFNEDPELKARVFYKDGFISSIILSNGQKSIKLSFLLSINKYTFKLDNISSKSIAIHLIVPSSKKRIQCYIQDTLNNQIGILEFDRKSKIQEITIYKLHNNSWNFSIENPYWEVINNLKFNRKDQIRKSMKKSNLIECCN